MLMVNAGVARISHRQFDQNLDTHFSSSPKIQNFSHLVNFGFSIPIYITVIPVLLMVLFIIFLNNLTAY